MKTSNTRKIKTHKPITYQQFIAARNQISLFSDLPVPVPLSTVDPYLGTPEDWKILENASHTHHLRPCYLARLALVSATSLRTADRSLIVYIHEPTRQQALEWLAQYHPNDQLHFLAPLAPIMMTVAPSAVGDRQVFDQKVSIDYA